MAEALDAFEKPEVKPEKAEKAKAQTPAKIEATTAVSLPEPAPEPGAKTAKTLGNTAVSAISVLRESAESGIIEAYREQLRDRVIVRNSEVENGLPIKGEPNSIADLVDDEGNVLKRRLHDSDGMASVDYDTGDHKRPDVHTTGAHKHVFDYTKKKPRGKNLPLTAIELLLNSDIIREGVNYFAGEKTH